MRKQTYFKPLIGLLIVFAVSSCQLFKRSQQGLTSANPILLDTISLDFSLEKPLPYRPAAERKIDIHHLELDLKFGLEKEEVYGKAALTLSAYAQPQDTISLDARGFEIHEVALTIDDSVRVAEYRYNQRKLEILLPFSMGVTDTFEVSVKYTARPSLLERGEGRAISSSQGLYFINAKGDIDGMPQQIWSQGETEYNSGWFPSIDKPHEKFTQEVFLTVDTLFKSISNGKLMYSTENGDGTRTDYWKQELPHSNYLVMIAIGDFAVVKDEWREKDVWYYVDHEFEEFADEIFGNTPEMLEFYSTILNYNYPWEKYHQIVVKDFVSGAMENTSAVIHGDFVQQTPREMLDGTHEDVIAHELFHHWFGDLVTAESWAQITMNEGFATYGEYLWQAHKYGIDEAKYHLSRDLEAYLDEARTKTKPLIRYRYENADDLFDRHSYQKGGRVIHMLRNEVGDDMFFKGLTHYLTTNEFSSVEDDHLRLSMEQVTGRDLKWFFDQWFHRQGHPIVDVAYVLDSNSNQLEVYITQNQTEEAFAFHVNLVLDNDDSLISHRLWIDQKIDTIIVQLETLPAWYAIDPDGDMLWQVNEVKPISVWQAQLSQYSRSAGKVSAMKAINMDEGRDNSRYQNELIDLIQSDEFWLTKAMASASLLYTDGLDTNRVVNALNQLIATEKKSDTRAVALQVLDSLTPNNADNNESFVSALSDSSYLVLKTALSILMQRDACAAIDHIQHLSLEENNELLLWSSRIHAQCGSISSLAFFQQNADQLTGVDAYMFNNDFAKYASNCDQEKVYDALVKHMSMLALNEESWWARISAVQALEAARDFYASEIQAIEANTEVSSDETERLAVLRNKKASLSALIDEAKEISSDEE